MSNNISRSVLLLLWLWCVLYIKDSILDKTLTLSKRMCVRTSGASELRQFWHFYILKLLFLINILSVQQILSQYKWHAMSSLHVPTNFQIYRQTLTLQQMYVYASRASLENVGIFTFLNCYFFQYFVGTADTLSVQMTCLSAYMYRQISYIPTNSNIEQMYVYASELRKFWHFYILNLLFLSIFCRYI